MQFGTATPGTQPLLYQKVPDPLVTHAAGIDMTWGGCCTVCTSMT